MPGSPPGSFLAIVSKHWFVPRLRTYRNKMKYDSTVVKEQSKLAKRKLVVSKITNLLKQKETKNDTSVVRG